MSIYDNLVKNQSPVTNRVEIICHFVDGPYLEILSPIAATYVVKFIDVDKNLVVYETTINNNNWSKASTKYFVNWKVEVYQNNKLIYEHAYNAAGKNVYISIESSSLGDSLAWMPYVELFQEAHECNVIVSTHLNHLFENEYKSIKFIKPGEIAKDLYAMYKIGYFYDPEMEPVLPHTIPLQKQACNILGLIHNEIPPRITHVPKNLYDLDKTITIATESTAGCKLWTNQGWQELITFLNEQGYTVINTSKDGFPYEGCTVLPFDPTLQAPMDAIASSRLFIGLASGMSWLAWALKVPVAMIANFSEEGHEFFSHIRITKPDVCHGCWNSHRFKFDKSDWNWCPVNKGTDRQFECMTTISSQMVINQIKNYI